jgi:hypothetical protein
MSLYTTTFHFIKIDIHFKLYSRTMNKVIVMVITLQHMKCSYCTVLPV